MKVRTYFNPSGRKRRELWSIILGFSEKLALDISAFSFGIVSSSSSSFFSSFLSPFPFFNNDFYFYFLFIFLSFFVWSHYSSVLGFFMKYLEPLNYLVKVALMKNILLLSFPKNTLSSEVSSISIVFFSISLVFFFFYGFGCIAGSAKDIKLAGISKSWSVGTELRPMLILTLFPFSFTKYCYG